MKQDDVHSAFDTIAELVMDGELESPYGRIATLYALFIHTSNKGNYEGLCRIIAKRTSEFGGWDWDSLVELFETQRAYSDEEREVKQWLIKFAQGFALAIAIFTFFLVGWYS